jgi:hypothetical protein
MHDEGVITGDTEDNAHFLNGPVRLSGRGE